MHVSLDSALGRQRRLNQVGETISSIAAPAAAYSLRSLTGGDPKVVRVRRESDNDEQDFTASEVSSGALVDFVNTQVTAPLDIQALTSTGRDGDFLIAKAAYSLRSLGTRQATVTSSGDTGGDTSGKFVCQVRRSSDDALKSFTADEITDGTLLSFVNNDLSIKQTTINNSNSYDTTTGTGTLTSSTSLGFTASGASSLVVSKSGFPQDFSVLAGKIKVTYNASGLTGSARILSRNTAGSSSAVAITISNGTGNTVTTTLTGETNLFIFDGISGSDVSLEITSLEIIGDGFVKTWYDQSVTTQAGDTATGNHATQATAASQPKIVSAGALNTSGGLEFDSTDDFFALTSSVNFQNLPFALFSVQDAQPDNNHRTLGCANTRGVSFSSSQTNYQFTANSATFNFSSVSGLNLYSALHDGTTNSDNITSHQNGSAPSSSSGSGFTQANSSSAWTNIGVRSGSSDFFHGTIKEIIVYNTDQTDNRTAIEANIGEHYSISGIPAFDNSVNGFVETWYDQSGNGNNAVQATASKQPKIVNAGSLNTDGGLLFDGTDDVLTTPVFSLTASDDLSLFTTFKCSDTSSFRAIISQKDGTGTGRTWIESRGASGYATFLGGGQKTFGATTTDKILFSLIYDDSDGTIDAFKNGTQSGSQQTSVAVEANDSEINIGATKTFASLYIGTIEEIIVYTTDQTDNRTAIETEIISHYGIS